MATIATEFAINILANAIWALKDPRGRKRIERKFRKALSRSIDDIAERFKLQYPLDSAKLMEKNTRKELLNTLRSPDIKKQYFLEILTKKGIDASVSEELYNNIRERFLEVCGEEAGNHPEVFRTLVLNYMNKSGATVEQIRNGLEPFKNKIPAVIRIINDMSIELRHVRIRVDKIYESMKQYEILFGSIKSTPLFKQGLEEAVTNLFQFSNLRESLIEDDWRLLIDLARKFENLWIYLSVYESLPYATRANLRMILKNLKMRFQEPLLPEMTCLQSLISILALDRIEVEGNLNRLRSCQLTAAEKLVTISEQLLFFVAVLFGNKRRAENLISELRKNPVQNKVELILLEAFLSIAEGSSVDITREKLHVLLGQLGKMRASKERSFIAGIISGAFDSYGFLSDAKQILLDFELDIYFPEFVRAHEYHECMVHEYDIQKATDILEDITASSQLSWFRKWARFEIISTRGLLLNPQKALKKVADLIEQGDIGPLSGAEFLLKYYMTMWRKGTDRSNILEKALKLAKPYGFGAMLRAAILLEKAASALMKGDLRAASETIEEAEQLPMAFPSRYQYLFLKANIAYGKKDFDSAERAIELGLRCPNIRLKLKILNVCIYVKLAQGNVEAVIDQLLNLLAVKDLRENDKIRTLCLLTETFYLKKDYENALKYGEKAYDLMSEVDLNYYIFDYGLNTVAHFMFIYLNTRLILVDKAIRALDYKVAGTLLEPFPSYLTSALKASNKKLTDLALKGCAQRIWHIAREDPDEAIKEIGNLLKLDLTSDQKAILSILKSDISRKSKNSMAVV